MAKKVIRFTESEFNRLVRETVKREKRKSIQEQNYFNPEAMETGGAIATMVITIMTLLGVAGSHYIKAMIDRLREEGKEEEAMEVESAMESYGEGGIEGEEDDEDIEEEY